jgi:hypothetical protein
MYIKENENIALYSAEAKIKKIVIRRELNNAFLWGNYLELKIA